ncbi:MAG TPA: response regulator [Nitrospirales bacterium]|nr:response regulator [Nitrospirales bacterium]
MKLLVIDDDQSVLAVIAEMIRTSRPDWEAHYVGDSADALNRLITQHYDLVLSDLHMPNLDGISMIRQAKDLLPRTPIVFLTGYKDRYAEAAWDLGAFAVLDKPIHVELLIETLEAALREMKSLDEDQ